MDKNPNAVSLGKMSGIKKTPEHMKDMADKSWDRKARAKRKERGRKAGGGRKKSNR